MTEAYNNLGLQARSKRRGQGLEAGAGLLNACVIVRGNVRLEPRRPRRLADHVDEIQRTVEPLRQAGGVLDLQAEVAIEVQRDRQPFPRPPWARRRGAAMRADDDERGLGARHGVRDRGGRTTGRDQRLDDQTLS